MSKKIYAIILAAIILICSLSACSSSNKNQNNHELVTQATTEYVTDETGFKLSYTQSDSLNPYESDTLNNQVVQNLVFESLFVLDEAYEAQPLLASGYSYTDSKTLSVTVSGGNTFSDGTLIDAESIIYAFNQAKDSYRWKNSLKCIESISAPSSTVVDFKLKYANPNAHKLLTFAIAKSENDENGYPIGSGRYKFGEGGGTVYLEVNPNKKDFNPHFTKIPLVNIASAESIENAINIGNISFAFRDLSEISNIKIQSNKKAVNLNNLVYIGINNKVGITKNENIRRAVSLATDRDALVKSAYQGYAKSAASIFNSSCSLGKQTVVFDKTADTAAAKQAITQSGYDEKDLKLDILVNSNSNRRAAAKLIKQQLEAVGFKVTINEESDKAYKNKVESGAFDLYIGETKLPADMNLNSFFTAKGATLYGIDVKKSDSAKAYQGYLNSENEIGSFVLSFTQEMPFVPLLYRQGMICYSKSLHGDMQGYVDNYFSNIQDWYYN
ncbi:MAG: ABC transporter substrate-binding protein [Ruminococcaceae bacterium]|nr:ABC transporter substrate-binding protein [Oscillospiraceae bacterium]